MIRLENIRVDKVLLKEYFKEIEFVIKNIEGLNDINSYREEFEKEFSRFIGSRYALAVSSGTDALQLALLSLGIGSSDSVIIPDLTYISTVLVVKYVGAKPILIDVKKENLTIDENKIERHIKPHTKAIIAVHMFGHPCNMKKIKEIAQKYKLYLIEDACQAFGSIYYGISVGKVGDISAFSLSYYKPLSSLGGNGGIIVFDKEEFKDKINRYLNIWKADIKLDDLNCKFNKISLTDIATAKIKLRYRKQIIKSKEQVKKLYETGLSNIKGIRIFKDPKNTFSVKENYLILVKNRDKLRKYLLKNYIESGLPYAPIHSLAIFQGAQERKDEFANTQDYYKNGLHLPLFTFMKEDECRFVIDTIIKFYK